jgi:hypothetical protein
VNAPAPPPVQTNIVFEHLRRIDATGIHQLAAINSDTDIKAFVTFRLEPEGIHRATAFLHRYGGSCNIYYSANEVRADLGDKRAKKADIANIRMIGADLDPPKGIQLTPEVLQREHQKLDKVREQVSSEPEAFYSFAVNSGGGIQLGWVLEEKLTASTFGQLAEDQTRGILRHLEAPESTADVTRLLRAPGTYNFPDRSKRKQGRQDILPATVIEYIDDSAATLDELSGWAPAVAPARTSTASGAASAVELDMEVVEDARASGQIPEALRGKLDRLMAVDEKLNRLWHGDKSAVGGSDTSGSAFGFALAVRLRPTGKFDATEYGQILAIWDHSSENLDERQIARAWMNSGAASASEELEPQVTTDRSSPIALRWVEPFDANSIPRREFIFGHFVAKHYLTALISPPGVGKTTFLIMMAVAVVTGRSDITGFKVHHRCRVLLWNQEDEHDELNRRLSAVMAAFDVKWEDLDIDGKPGLVLGSGVDRALMFARKDGDVVLRSKDAAYIEEFIKENGVGVAIFDPFVELHQVNENDNTDVAAVARIFRQIAVRGGCGVVLAHHTRKPPNAANRESYAGDMDAGRGAGSLNGVARMVATLYTVDAATAKRYGIPEIEARQYVRFDDGKANMSLISGAPTFFKREGITIGGFGGEEVGILRPTKLDLARTSSEAKAGEDAIVRRAVHQMLRHAEGHRLDVTSIATNLLEAGALDLVSPDTLRKRIKTMFEAPQRYENGDVVKRFNGSLKGKQGRSVILVVEFAEK